MRNGAVVVKAIDGNGQGYISLYAPGTWPYDTFHVKGTQGRLVSKPKRHGGVWWHWEPLAMERGLTP